MQYYDIIFPKYNSPIKSIFTYQSKSSFNIGDAIVAPLRNKEYLGIVLKKVSKPEFKTRDIIKLYYPNLLNSAQLKLFDYINQYYFANPSRTISLFTPKKLDRINEEKYQPNLDTETNLVFNPPNFDLNPTQQNILNSLNTETQKIHLIHGITGSGKTILYLKRAEEVIKQGQQALILVPEISLTPQTIQIFEEYFSKEIISLYHSRLTPIQQLKEWLKIKTGQSKIIIGSRSSLFLPFQNLGLIVIDEEHDFAYKQEQNPRYHARTIAQWYQKHLSIQLILGSATPSLETYIASTKNPSIIKHEMLHRSQYQELPPIHLIDLKEEYKKGNYHIISEPLQSAIQNSLNKKEQILILHNKRGFARYLLCTDCGHVFECPNCSISLTVHRTTASTGLQCHYCDYHTSPPANCITCQSTELKSIGSGTQKIFDELDNLFPNAIIKRVDSDTTNYKNAHQEIYDSLKEGHFDIIVGTQMIATGLDIANIGLVAVTNADISINLPDFRATERTFQLLTQVSGRTGRGEKEGLVLVQTHNPEHPVLQSFLQNNVKNFLKQEATIRKQFHYPPYTKLTKLTFSHSNQSTVKNEINKICSYLTKHKIEYKSAPALIEKRSNKYYHHILIDSLNPEKIITQLNLSPSWWVDRDPANTL